MALQFEPVYTSDFLKVEADASARVVRTEWLRNVTVEELIQGTKELHTFLSESQFEKLLGNGQKLVGLSTEAKNWLSNFFYDLLSETNLKQLARIMPENLFSKLALESVITRAEAAGKINYAIKNFPKEEEGLAWLDIKS